MRAMLVAGILAVTPWVGAEAPAQTPQPASARVDVRPLTEMERFGGADLGGGYAVWGAKGSVAAGVTLGPLGVAANVASINARNRERGAALGEAAAADLGAVLQAAVDSSAARTPGVVLTPVVLFQFETPTSFQLICAVHARPEGARPRAQKAYAVWTDGAFEVASPERLAAAREVAVRCIGDAHRLFVQHTGGALSFGASQRFQSGRNILDQPLEVAGQAASPPRFVAESPRAITEFQRTPLHLALVAP